MLVENQSIFCRTFFGKNQLRYLLPCYRLKTQLGATGQCGEWTPPASPCLHRSHIFWGQWENWLLRESKRPKTNGDKETKRHFHPLLDYNRMQVKAKKIAYLITISSTDEKMSHLTVYKISKHHLNLSFTAFILFRNYVIALNVHILRQWFWVPCVMFFGLSWISADNCLRSKLRKKFWTTATSTLAPVCYCGR